MAIWVTAVTIGPILGPALGGWLTENYNWRWVFYINVPFGILAFLGILTFMPETQLRKSRFDFFGFAALSLAIGAFQLMLDRGQLKDWFSSTEIWIEAVIAGLALYLFIVHMLTTKRAPFVSPALFKDRNFLTGNLFIFVVGVVLFATLALLPPHAAGPDGLSRGADRPGDRAARPRHAGRDVHRRPPDGPGRYPPHHRRRLCADCLLALADDALLPADGHRVGGLVGPDAGPGHRLRLRAARRHHLRHAVPAIPQRGHGPLQPGAQHRQQHRHLGGDDAASRATRRSCIRAWPSR